MMDYEIIIDALPSNLGKGVNLYFICPVCGKRAKILYYCLKTHLFIHRKEYAQRLYYPIQTYGKVERIPQRFEMNDKKLLNLFKQQKKDSFQGQVTRSNVRIQKLIDKRRVLDLLVIQYMEKKFKVWESKFN